MSNTPAHTTKQQTKKKFIVSREFSGNQSMREAFEQLIERQSHSHFEEWLEKKAGYPKHEYIERTYTHERYRNWAYSPAL